MWCETPTCFDFTLPDLPAVCGREQPACLALSLSLSWAAHMSYGLINSWQPVNATHNRMTQLACDTHKTRARLILKMSGHLIWVQGSGLQNRCCISNVNFTLCTAWLLFTFLRGNSLSPQSPYMHFLSAGTWQNSQCRPKMRHLHRLFPLQADKQPFRLIAGYARGN